MLAALVLLKPVPLTLELTLPKTVVSGEKIDAKATVRNVSTRSIVLVEAILPNTALGMRIDRTIRGPSGNVIADERGPMMGQWFGGQQVPESAFFVLKPGDRRELYVESFSARFLGERPGLISEYVKAPRSPLSPGTYLYRLKYRLTPTVPMRSRSWGSDFRDEVKIPEEFTPQTRRLFDACWGGTIEAETTFTVVARP